MPSISAADLTRISQRLFEAVGTPPATAAYLAYSLVTNDLVGHDSHGVIRIPYYLGLVKDGTLFPAVEPTLLQDAPALAVVDGQWTYGQVAARFATQTAVAKARQTGLSAVGVVHCHHTGRIGEFAEMVAEAGMIGMAVAGGPVKPEGASVAPYGGASRILATNPYSFAVPVAGRPPLVIDFATSAVAEGKVQMARAKGETLPEGLIIDKHGRPSVNPDDLYDGGALLPFGAHKGYALSLLAEVLASFLFAAEVYGRDRRTVGFFILALDVAHFRALADFEAALDQRVRQVKATPPAPGHQEVMLPGEPEYRTRLQRQQEGIPVVDTTWQQLVALGWELGVDVVDVGR